MKVTTVNMAGPNNGLELPGTHFKGTEQTHPSLEAAMEYINEHVQDYYLGNITYIPVITSVEDTAREQFIEDAKGAIDAFAGALNHMSDNNPHLRKVNGVWRYTDALDGTKVRAEIKVEQRYGTDYR